MSEQRFSISISLPSLLLTGLLVLLTVLLWQVKGLLLIVMTSVVVAAAIAPIVDKFEDWRLPRWLATVVAYVGLISTLIGVGLLAGPTVFDQVESLIRQVPTFIEIVRGLLEAGAARLGENQSELVGELLDPQAISRWALGYSRQFVLRSYGLTRNILGTAFSTVLVLFLSGYMVADNRTLLNGLVRLLPQPWEDRFAAQVRPVGSRMGGYIRGRLLVSSVLGVGITIGLSALGLKDYALGLGAIAAVTNLVPFIGPILGSVPALLVALSVGGWAPLWVLILFVIVQNLETYVLDPLLVGSTVGIHPLYQLLAVLSGAQLLGIIGALIVPPWFAGVAVLIENLYLRPKIVAERRSIVIATSANTTLKESMSEQFRSN